MDFNKELLGDALCEDLENDSEYSMNCDLLDKSVYIKIKALLNKNDAINFIKYHDFISKAYEMKNVEGFYEYIKLCNDDFRFEFIDKELEESRLAIKRYISELIDLLRCNTFAVVEDESAYIFNQTFKSDYEKVLVFSNELYKSSVNLDEEYRLLVEKCRMKFGLRK